MSDVVKHRLGMSIESKRLLQMPVLQSPSFPQRQILRASHSGMSDVGGKEETYRRPLPDAD